MKQWRVYAPNGFRVIVNTGPYTDTEFKQGDLVDDPNLAVVYPTIFRPIQEIVMENKGPQILTEVPKPRKFEPETDKPDQKTDKSDDDEEDSSIANFFKKEVGDELNIDVLDEKYTKKQLESICADFGIETKKLTKAKILDIILEA